MKVADLMAKDVATLERNDELVGLLTESDLLRVLVGPS